MTAASPGSSAFANQVWPKVLAGAVGAVLGLGLMKFGNPVILDRLVEPPTTQLEFVFNPWPVAWGYTMLAGVVLIGLPVAKFNARALNWIVILPLGWLVWQLIAAANTVDARLSRPTVFHFTACLGWFYLGLFSLSRVRALRPFWICLLVGFVWVLWIGFDQHFGGLEATRRMVYEQPDWQRLPPEYLKRIGSNRIFSTLVYPNALAGAILLLLPCLVTALWQMTARLSNISRGVLAGLLAYSGLACLYWSGSKSGWLIALGLMLVAALWLPKARRFKLAIAAAALAFGLVGFFVKFSDYFGRGATSVSARFDYWRAAWEIAKANPVLGTGPGTFSVPYARLKAPGSEMTRLVHNDYLEQVSDSGFIGFFMFAGFWVGSLALLYRQLNMNPLWRSVWLGLLGWAVQSLVEFGLYIPALAWPAFAFTGWLWGANPEMKSTPEPASS